METSLLVVSGKFLHFGALQSQTMSHANRDWWNIPICSYHHNEKKQAGVSYGLHGIFWLRGS